MNPSNQPEPKPDAQAEVGLRNQLLTLKDRDGQYVVGSLLAEDPMRLHALIDFIQADKAAAVVEAYNRGYVAGHHAGARITTEKRLTAKDKERLNMWAEKKKAELARLQPPTAGEGESV